MTESNGPQVELQGLEITVGTLTAEGLLEHANELGESLRGLILAAKRLPKDKDLEPHQDAGRALALAQSNLQTGFMWLRRAIEAPKVF